MDTGTRSLTQTLAALESDGASGSLTIGEDGASRTLLLTHGRLALPPTAESDEQLRGALYGHGFEADDHVAARVAVIDRLTGVIATAMVGAEPRLSFAPSEPTSGDSIPTSTAVLDARRRIAESERLTIQVPGDDAVPDRVRGAAPSTSHLSRFVGTTFAAIDGSRNLHTLAADLHVDIAAVRRAVFRLSVLGLVVFDRAVAPSPSSGAGAASASDWATDTLVEAIEEPEPWIGYAEGDPDAAPPARRTPAAPPSSATHSVVREAEAAEAVEIDTPAPRPTSPPSRQRPLDDGERRESLRQAAAWLADIDHADEDEPAAAEPAPAPEPDPEVAPEPGPTNQPPPAEDVSDFLRELSQLSRDDD